MPCPPRWPASQPFRLGRRPAMRRRISTHIPVLLGLASLAVLDLLGATRAVSAQIPISACPFETTGPGNYVVTQNLTATNTCITISHDHVAIDLNGRTITGNGDDGAGITDDGDEHSGI